MFKVMLINVAVALAVLTGQGQAAVLPQEEPKPAPKGDRAFDRDERGGDGVRDRIRHRDRKADRLSEDKPIQSKDDFRPGQLPSPPPGRFGRGSPKAGPEGRGEFLRGEETPLREIIGREVRRLLEQHQAELRKQVEQVIRQSMRRPESSVKQGGEPDGFCPDKPRRARGPRFELPAPPPWGKGSCDGKPQPEMRRFHNHNYCDQPCARELRGFPGRGPMGRPGLMFESPFSPRVPQAGMLRDRLIQRFDMRPRGPLGMRFNIIRRLDRDRNGSISSEEFQAGMKKLFNRLDQNHDGRISREELAQARATMFQRPDGSGPRSEKHEKK